MTREEFAKNIHWPVIIWTIGLVNIGAMLSQIYQLLQARQTEVWPSKCSLFMVLYRLLLRLKGI